MSVFNKLSSENKRSGARRVITFSLSVPSLIASIVGAGCVLGWVFFLGILLGRGDTPEAHIPELERRMPQAQQGQGLYVRDGSTNGTETQGEIIGLGDLEYRDSLRPQQRPQTQPAQTPAAPQAPARDPQTVAGTAPLPAIESPQAAPARQQPATRPTQQQPATPPTQNARPAASLQGQFDYVYQVAAYREAAASDRFVEKLKKAGVQARTQHFEETNGSWYKTMIDFRGTPDAIDGLREKLKPHGVNRLILKGKTPAK